MAIEKITARDVFCGLHKADRLHSAAFDKVLEVHQLHRSQHLVLMWLDHLSGSVSQKILAEKMGISAAAVAVSMRKLEDKEMISRESDPEDKRYNLVRLTQKGIKVLESSKHAFQEVDQKMFEDFSEEEMENLFEMIHRMQKNLEKNGKEENL